MPPNKTEMSPSEQQLDTAIRALIANRDVSRDQMALEFAALEQVARGGFGGLMQHTQNSLAYLETIKDRKRASKGEKEVVKAFQDYIAVLAGIVNASGLAIQTLPCAQIIADATTTEKSKLIKP